MGWNWSHSFSLQFSFLPKKTTLCIIKRTMETYPIYTILHMGLVAEEKVFHYTWKKRQNLYIQRSQCTKRSRLGGLLFVKVPSKLSSGITKSRKMTYRGLANSGLWQAGIGLSPVSHLAKSAKRIWGSQLPKVIFRGQAIPDCRKPELVRPQ